MFSLPRQFLGLSDKSNASTDNERSGELPSEIVNSPSSNPSHVLHLRYEGETDW